MAPGGAIRFMVSTTARSFTAAAYRIGGYRGGDGRLAWESPSIPRTPQPAATLLPSTRTVVAHWAPSFTVRTGGWSPGFYLMKLSAASGYQAYVPFTVRSPTTRGRIVLVAPLIDWEAYNTWGGYDLYRAPPYQYRSWAVSFDRPNPAPGADQFLYNVLPTVVLAERLGLRLAYETDVDVAARPGLLDGATGLVTMGHDEYWTEQERRHVTAARNRGTNLAFLSSNTMYWQVRLHGSQRGPDRVVVAYKTEADTNDPLRLTQPGLVTGRWRDLPDADPENSLTGTLYECYPVDEPYRVAAPHWWGFAGTGVRRGTELPHLVGDEADRVYPIPSTPHPLQILSYLTYDCGGVLTSTESTYYTTRSGAGVIDLGTQRWTCALAPRCPGLPPQDDLFARQVTTNVLHAFAAGPAGVAHPARDNVGRFWLPAVNEVPTS
ncbi:MAG: N,N-dimethylformamidase beta subunit family domain-containing protein [Nocardioidaceae bacterium]